MKIVNNLVSVVFSSNTDVTGYGKSYIVVYEAATGKQVWKSTTFPGDALYHFAIDQNTIYFGSINTNTQPFTGKVYAYNIQSNKELWSTPVDGGAQEQFAISNGVLYTAVDHGGTMDSHLLAINAATGAIKWQQTLDTVVLNSFAISNGIVYTGRYNGLYSNESSLEAFKADNGQKLWEGAQYGNGNLVATE
jgi:outer membrane protein assembly factor BamB